MPGSVASSEGMDVCHVSCTVLVIWVMYCVMDPTLLLEFYVATSFDTTILLTWLIANLGLDRSLNIPFVALKVNKYVLQCLHVGLKIDRDFFCKPFSSLMLEVEFCGLEATCILIIWIFYSLSFVFFFFFCQEWLLFPLMLHSLSLP